MKYFDYSYRELEGISPVLIGKNIDHSTVGWAMKKMPIDYIDKAIQLLYEKIDKLCVAENIFITDSTGISTDRYKEVIRALKKTRECIYLKMHILVKYFFNGFIAIISAKVTDGDRNDSPILREHLKKGICKSGTLLADMGYDSEDI